jgi:predicted metal-binding protein
MGINDYLKCPGLEHAIDAVPEIYGCPDCGNSIEIRTDKKKGKCSNCGAIVKNRNPYNSNLSLLSQETIQLGASDARIILSTDIIVENDLALLCKSDPQCENYGMSKSCPPHVPGPTMFRNWQQQSKYSIVVRIDIPSAVMFSDDRREVMQLLHEMVAGVEQKASAMGYVGSKAFAGGSCKKIFCQDHEACRALSKQGDCRNPQSARPSMSGFGINVGKLMQSAGWETKKIETKDASDMESMTWVAGLILIKDAKK